MLYIASGLLVLIGLVHSYLGEKYILIRLFKRENLPILYGSDWLTKRVLRFAWHITTVAWWGFAAILVVMALPNDNLEKSIQFITGIVFFISGLFSALFSRGKHLSWVVFWVITGLCLYAAFSA